MPFCPVCKSEFRPGFDRCEECDASLVAELPSPPDHPKPPLPAFRTVYSTTELPDALLTASLLEGNGIEAEVHNERSGLYVIGFPTSATPITIAVPSADSDVAEGIIREAKKSRFPSPAAGADSRRKWLAVIALLLVPLAVIPFNGGPGGLAIGWTIVLILIWIWSRMNRVEKDGTVD